MDTFANGVWWAGGVLAFVIIFILAMLLRNHTAKTDSVNHSKSDTTRNSVSLGPKRNTRKLD